MSLIHCSQEGDLWRARGLQSLYSTFFGQAEEAAAEIARKLEKQEKKRLKKEKKRLAAVALASSGNSSSTPEECEVSRQIGPEQRSRVVGFSTGRKMCGLKAMVLNPGLWTETRT